MSHHSPPNLLRQTADSVVKSTETKESLGSTVESGSKAAVKGGELNSDVSNESTEVGTDKLDTHVGEQDDDRRHFPEQSTSSGEVNSSSGVVELDQNNHQMPVHGDFFPSLSAFQQRCSTTACSTIGYNYHAVSSLPAMVCARNQQEHCRARIVVRKTNAGSATVGWIVQGYLCHYHHSHEKHPNILKDPKWRPTVNLVKGFDEAKAASLPAFDALNVNRPNHPQNMTVSQSKQRHYSVDIVKKYPLPSMGSVYESQDYLRRSVMKSNFDVGYQFQVSRSPGQSDNYASVTISCKQNSSTYGHGKCPAFIRAYLVDRNLLDGAWKIVELNDAHNHPPVIIKRAWKPPKPAPSRQSKLDKFGRKRHYPLSGRAKAGSDGEEDSYEGSSSSSEEESDESEESEYGCRDDEEDTKETVEKIKEDETMDTKPHIPSKRSRESDTNQSNKFSRKSSTVARLSSSSNPHCRSGYLPSPSVSTSTSMHFASIPTHDPLTVVSLSSLLYTLSPALLPYADSLFSEGLDSMNSLTNLMALPRKSKRKLSDRWVKKEIISAFPGTQLTKKLHEMAGGSISGA